MLYYSQPFSSRYDYRRVLLFATVLLICGGAHIIRGGDGAFTISSATTATTSRISSTSSNDDLEQAGEPNNNNNKGLSTKLEELLLKSALEGYDDPKVKVELIKKLLKKDDLVKEDEQGGNNNPPSVRRSRSKRSIPRVIGFLWRLATNPRGWQHGRNVGLRYLRTPKGQRDSLDALQGAQEDVETLQDLSEIIEKWLQRIESEGGVEGEDDASAQNATPQPSAYLEESEEESPFTTNLTLVDAVKLDYLQAVQYHVEQDPTSATTPDAEGYAPVHHAAAWGSLKSLTYLIEEVKVDKDTKTGSPERYTPLHLGVLKNYKYIVDYLISKRADVDAPTSSGKRPLHLAVNGVDREGSLRMVRALVEATAYVNSKDNDLVTPLHLAASKCDGRSELVQYLIDAWAVLYLRTRKEETPLHAAAQADCDLRVVQILVQARVEVNAKNRDGKTALDLARPGSPIYNYLLQLHQSTTTTTTEKVCESSSLVEAILKDDPEEMRCRIQTAGDNATGIDRKSGYAPIHTAAAHNKLQALKYLVEELGVNLNSTTHFYEQSPLHLATSKGHLAIMEYLVEEHGADLRARDSEQRTPLHAAAAERRLLPLKYLVDHFAGTDVLDSDERSPLHYAAAARYLPTVEYLVDHGADINLKDVYGRNPFHEAIRHCLNTAENLQLLQFLKREGAYTSIPDNERNTPMHSLAASSRDKPLIGLWMLEANAGGLFVKNKYGQTPFEIAELPIKPYFRGVRIPRERPVVVRRQTSTTTTSTFRPARWLDWSDESEMPSSTTRRTPTTRRLRIMGRTTTTTATTTTSTTFPPMRTTPDLPEDFTESVSSSSEERK